MGLFQRKREKTEKKEIKQYITGAGATIVTKSVLEGRTRLKWFFREKDGIGNGWVAFGEGDSQEYVNDAKNMELVDFNILANVEPTVLNVFYMPAGTELEFRDDKSGKYFVNVKTGEEIREPVKNPLQFAFEKNLKFLNKEQYPAEFFEGLFREGKYIRPFVMGEADFPGGKVVIADPLAYLGNEKYSLCLNRPVPRGAHPVELSIFRSPIAGLRIAAARLVVSGEQTVRYEIAMPFGKSPEDFGKPGVWNIMGVDTGLGCFCDEEAAREYGSFLQKWHENHPGKNHYDDYFAKWFRESYEQHPDIQREGGDFLVWKTLEGGCRIAMFTSGMGDGIYSAYWGLDGKDEVTQLVIPFMNPEYFL